MRARDYGIRFEDHSHTQAAVRVSTQARIEEALRFAVAHSTEREAVIDRRALEATALQHAMGVIDLDQLRREGMRLGTTPRADRPGRFHRLTGRHLHHSRDGRP